MNRKYIIINFIPLEIQEATSENALSLQTCGEHKETFAWLVSIGEIRRKLKITSTLSLKYWQK